MPKKEDGQGLDGQGSDVRAYSRKSVTEVLSIDGIYPLSVMADKLGTTTRFLSALISKGELKARKLGRATFVTGQALADYLNETPQGPKAKAKAKAKA